MVHEFITDFEFKGERDYVHSTTMLEELTRLVYKNFYSEGEWEKSKIDAKFHKPVLFNGKFQISENRDELLEGNIASADFKFYDNKHKIEAQFVEDKNNKVTKSIKTNYSVEDVVVKSDFSGICRINCSSRTAMVENVIEANKRIHQITLNDKSNFKVINLYMKKFPVSLPIFRLPNSDKILLKIENIGIRHRDDSVATLNSLYFPELKTDRFELSYIVYGI